MQKRSRPNHIATKRPLEHSLLFPETKARLFPTAAPPESGTVCRMNAAVLLLQFVRGGIMSKVQRSDLIAVAPPKCIRSLSCQCLVAFPRSASLDALNVGMSLD